MRGVATWVKVERVKNTGGVDGGSALLSYGPRKTKEKLGRWATWDVDCATSDDDWTKTGMILLRGGKMSGLDS